MKFIFYLIVIVGLYHFLFKKERFDFFLLAFFSAIIYFLPGFFGYGNIEYSGGESINFVLNYKAYLIMCIIITGIILTSILYEFLNNRDLCMESKSNNNRKFVLSLTYMDNIVLLLTILSFILILKDSGNLLMYTNKLDLLKNINRWYIAWETSIYIGFIISLHNKNKINLIIYLIFMSLDILIGFRFNTVLTLVSAIMFVYSKKERKALIKRRKLIFGSFLLIFIVLLLAQILALIKAKEYTLLAERLNNTQTYLNSITKSEPFVIQAILNQVLAYDFQVGPEHLKSLLYLIIPFSNDLGAAPISFNSLYQHILFGQVPFQMANNIWAEAWSVGGWGGFIIMIIIYLTGVWIGSKLLSSKLVSKKIFACSFFSCWTFYIHRNDLLYQLTMQRRILIWFFLIWIITYIISNFMIRYKSTDEG